MIIINMSERKYKKTLRDYNPPYQSADWAALRAQLPEQPKKRLWQWAWLRYAAVILVALFVGLGAWHALRRHTPQDSEGLSDSHEKAVIEQGGRQAAIDEPPTHDGEGQGQKAQLLSQKNANQNRKYEHHKEIDSPDEELPPSDREIADETVKSAVSGNEERVLKGEQQEVAAVEAADHNPAGHIAAEGAEEGQEDTLSETTIHTLEGNPPPTIQKPIELYAAAAASPLKVSYANNMGQMPKPEMTVSTPEPLLSVARGETSWRLSVGAVMLPLLKDSEENILPTLTLGRQWTVTDRVTGGIGIGYGQHRNNYKVSEYDRSDNYARVNIRLNANYHLVVKRKWSLYTGVATGLQVIVAPFSLVANDLESSVGTPSDIPPLDQGIIQGKEIRSSRGFIGMHAGLKVRVYRGLSAFGEVSSTLNALRLGVAWSK